MHKDEDIKSLILFMHDTGLSAVQKSLISFSLLFSGLAALIIEFSAVQYKLIFEEMGAKLPWLTVFNLEWYLIFANFLHSSDNLNASFASFAS